MVKIGAELPKLSQKLNWVSVFWTTLYVAGYTLMYNYKTPKTNGVSASEMTYIVLDGALNSTHTLINYLH